MESLSEPLGAVESALDTAVNELDAALAPYGYAALLTCIELAAFLAVYCLAARLGPELAVMVRWPLGLAALAWQSSKAALPLLRTGSLPWTAELAQAADAHLDVSVAEEACPLNLAPTASTTATLAMGDALAVALLKNRGFTAEDFARSHPSGSLGKRLILRVADVMREGDGIPVVGPDVRLRDGLMEMTEKGLGMTAIVDAENRILGIFTDGDLRRALDAGADVHHTPMSEVMHEGSKSISADVLAAEAVHILEENKITALLVVDADDRLAGALNIHDLFRAGIM